MVMLNDLTIQTASVQSENIVDQSFFVMICSVQNNENQEPQIALKKQNGRLKGT
jgi:hypothetical protein